MFAILGEDVVSQFQNNPFRTSSYTAAPENKVIILVLIYQYMYNKIIDFELICLIIIYTHKICIKTTE